MGLLEEAISEFQKVAKASDNGRAFRYTMQCCTLLGLAFMEKGQPAIAAIWYERALHTPGIDPESTLALRSEEHTSELQSRLHLVCRLLLEKKTNTRHSHSRGRPAAPGPSPWFRRLTRLSARTRLALLPERPRAL